MNSQQSTHWQLIGTIIWSVVIFVVFNVAQVAAIVTSLSFQGRPASDIAQALFEGNLLSIGVIASLVACVSTILIAVKAKKGSNVIDYLAIKSFDKRLFIQSFMQLLLIIVLANILLYLTPDNQNSLFMLNIYQTADPKWFLLMAVVIAAPIYEELFFRGFLFKGMQHSLLGISGTVVVTSLLWAIIHMQYDYLYIATIFVLGLFLGYTRYRSQSVLLPIALHMIYNLVATIEVAYFM